MAETTPPRVVVEVDIIPDAASSRAADRKPIIKRVRSRAEVRALIAQWRDAYDLLPDDGLDEPGADGTKAAGWTAGQLLEAIEPLGTRQLRAIVRAAHDLAPDVVEQAVAASVRPAEPEPVLCQAHGGDAGPADCDRCWLEQVKRPADPDTATAEHADPTITPDKAADPRQCPAGLLREAGDWGAACQKDAGHEPPHDGQDGEWDDAHPRHVDDLHARFTGLEDAAAPEDPPNCGLPVWGDEERPCGLAAGHGPVLTCSGRKDGPAPDGEAKHPDCARPGCRHPRHHHWEFGPTTPSSPASGCDMTGCPCPAYAATFDVVRRELRGQGAISAGPVTA